MAKLHVLALFAHSLPEKLPWCHAAHTVQTKKCSNRTTGYRQLDYDYGSLRRGNSHRAAKFLAQVLARPDHLFQRENIKSQAVHLELATVTAGPKT